MNSSLLRNTFLYLTDSEDPLDYVQSQLNQIEEWKWPGLLGLQALGLTVDEKTPLSGKFQSDSCGFTGLNFMAVLNKQSGRSSNLVRSEELELLWVKKPKPMTWHYKDEVVPG